MIAFNFAPYPILGAPWDGILTVASVVVAFSVIVKTPGFLWSKIIQPFARSVVEIDTVTQLAKVAPDLIMLSHMGPVLVDIASQFKTDSGSSLRDVINRLELTAKENSAALKEAAKIARTTRAEADATAVNVEKVRKEAATEVASVAKDTAAALALAVEAVKHLAALDAGTLQEVLKLAASTDATATRIEDTNPTVPRKE
jgi:hypothetical protein